MNKEERKELVLTSLLENDNNKGMHYNKMKAHLSSENDSLIYSAPVNPKYLEIDHTPIIIADNVFDALTTIDEYNLKKRKEVPFVIYGKKTKGGAIFLDDLYCDFSKLKEGSANIDKLEAKKRAKICIIFGISKGFAYKKQEISFYFKRSPFIRIPVISVSDTVIPAE